MKKVLFSIFSFLFLANSINASSLPKLYFRGNISNMETKADERVIFIKYESDSVNFESYAKIKIQGTSSLAYEKKNYTIKLYSDKDVLNKKKVDVGWGEQYKYGLKANWIDKTHARNIVTANIASSIQERYQLFLGTPNYGLIDGFPVEIYDNGEFLGLYTLNIPKSDWMFSMDEENENHIVLSGNGWTDATFFKDEATFQDWEVEVGKANEETLNKLNRMIRFVKNSSDQEFKEHLEEYFNLDSLLNYYVLCEYADLLDNVGKNMLLVTYDGKVWYTSLYDLDTSWGTQYYGWDVVEDYKATSEIQKSLLFQKLSKNFPKELANRYFALRKEFLTTSNVLSQFEKFENSIPNETFEKEQERWIEIPGYGLDQIEEFLNVRTPVMDQEFYKLYDDDLEVHIKYKITDDGVVAKLVSNREDLVILNDDKHNSHFFTENGDYTFYYQDWEGNQKGSIIAKVDWIGKNYTPIFTSSFKIYIVPILALVGFVFYYKMKER